jgi:hypothetical protein
MDAKVSAVLAEMKAHFEGAAAWAAAQRTTPTSAPFISAAAAMKAYLPVRALLDERERGAQAFPLLHSLYQRTLVQHAAAAGTTRAELAALDRALIRLVGSLGGGGKPVQGGIFDPIHIARSGLQPCEAVFEAAAAPLPAGGAAGGAAPPDAAAAAAAPAAAPAATVVSLPPSTGQREGSFLSFPLAPTAPCLLYSAPFHPTHRSSTTSQALFPPPGAGWSPAHLARFAALAEAAARSGSAARGAATDLKGGGAQAFAGGERLLLIAARAQKCPSEAPCKFGACACGDAPVLSALFFSAAAPHSPAYGARLREGLRLLAPEAPAPLLEDLAQRYCGSASGSGGEAPPAVTDDDVYFASLPVYFAPVGGEVVHFNPSEWAEDPSSVATVVREGGGREAHAHSTRASRPP